MAGGRWTILWEYSNLVERTLGSAGRSNQASWAKPCQLTLREEVLNDSKIQIEFLLGWVRHIHMRSGLGETSPMGSSPRHGCAGGRHLYPLSPRGKEVLKKVGIVPWQIPTLIILMAWSAMTVSKTCFSCFKGKYQGCDRGGPWGLCHLSISEFSKICHLSILAF